MYTVYLIKLKDYRGLVFPELNVLAEKCHDAQRAYCEYLNLDYDRFDNNDWESSQELNPHCDYDIEDGITY